MSLRCLLRSTTQRCPVWPLPRVATHPLVRRFFSNAACQGKKSIAEELGLPQPPTKPLLPFTKYMSMGHKEYPHLSWNERIRLLSDKWNKQSAEERAQRLKEYYEEKKEFQLKYKAYISQLTPEQVKSLEEAVDRRKKAKESANSKREKKKEMERLGRPKHPNNCFILFLSSLRSSNPPAAQGHKEFLVHASAKWKALPEAERQRFKEEGERRMRRYEEEMALWEQEMVRIGRPELVRKCSSLRSDATFREQTPEVKVPSDAPLPAPTQSQVEESPGLERRNASLEPNRETILEIHPEERVPRNSASKVSLTDENLNVGISSNSNLRGEDIFAQWRGRASDLCSGDYLYGENLENENVPLHVEDEILNEIEGLRLNSPPLIKEYGRPHHPLPSLHSKSTFFGAESN